MGSCVPCAKYSPAPCSHNMQRPEGRGRIEPGCMRSGRSDVSRSHRAGGAVRYCMVPSKNREFRAAPDFTSEFRAAPDDIYAWPPSRTSLTGPATGHPTAKMNLPRLGPISICVDVQPRGPILRSFRGTPKSSGFLCVHIYSSCRSCRPESLHFLCWDGLSALKVTAPAAMFQSQ